LQAEACKVRNEGDLVEREIYAEVSGQIPLRIMDVRKAVGVHEDRNVEGVLDSCGGTDVVEVTMSQKDFIDDKIIFGDEIQQEIRLCAGVNQKGVARMVEVEIGVGFKATDYNF